MKRSPIQQLLELHGLGVLLEAPVSIRDSGHCSGWQIVTDQGKYFAKALRKVFFEPFNGIKSTETLAKYFHSQGVLTRIAIGGSEHLVTVIDDWQWIVYPWIEGEIVRTPEIEHLERIGALLGEIHCRREPFQKPMVGIDWPYVERGTWQDLINRGRQYACSWADYLSERLEILVDWSRQYREVMDSRSTSCVSHQDLTPNNVIWTSSGDAYVIDWDLSGRNDPMVELLGVAMNWAAKNKQLEKDRYLTVIEAYQSKTGLPVDINTETWRLGLGSWLYWFVVLAQWSLQLGQCDKKTELEMVEMYELLSSTNQRDVFIKID